MDEIKRIFESENVRIGFDEFLDDCGRILVASKDRGFREYDRWVINHLSIDDIREDIDLGGEIAHSYGGGGHKKAAGSRFNNESIFDNISNIIFCTQTDDTGIL